MWAPIVIPARSSARTWPRVSQPGLPRTTVITKNVATKWCSRSTGSTRVYCPAEASSKVSRIGLRGSFAPRATWSTSASPVIVVYPALSSARIWAAKTDGLTM